MEVKGTAVLAIRDFVKKIYTSEYEKWIDILPSESKEIFSNTIDSTAWYPAGKAALEPTKAIGNLFFSSDLKNGAWESGRYSAEKALTGIYKIFVKASSPGFIIARAKDLFARYYRPCVMRVIENKDKTVILEVTNLDAKDQLIEFRVAGWIEKALEISGCKSVAIEIEKPSDESITFTRFNINWQ